MALTLMSKQPDVAEDGKFGDPLVFLLAVENWILFLLDFFLPVVVFVRHAIENLADVFEYFADSKIIFSLFHRLYSCSVE